MNNLLTGFVDVSVGSRNVSTHTNRATPPRPINESAMDLNSNAAVYPGQVVTVHILETHNQESSALKVATKWKHHLYSIHSATDVDAISDTVESVFEAVTQLGPTSVDLRGVASNSVNAEHLVAVLRATNASKDLIPGWKHALGEAPAALRRAGLDPEEVLVGLIV